MVEETSKIAFERIQDELGERQLQVYNTLKVLRYATNAMIASYLRLGINQVTPRILELRKMGFVRYAFTSECIKNHHLAKYWTIRW